MGARIPIDQSKIDDFCRRWRIEEMSLFGSVLRRDFRPDSDVDVLVTFAEGVRYGLSELVQMEEGLRAIFGREIDLITRRSVEQSPNYIRRKKILQEVETIHGG